MLIIELLRYFLRYIICTCNNYLQFYLLYKIAYNLKKIKSFDMPRVKKEQEITAYLKFVSECDVIDLNTVSAFVGVCNCFLS